jgi:hypothetical protein
MQVFHYVVRQYVGGRYVRDLKLDARRVGDQLLDGQKFYVLGGRLLDVLHDQYVVLMCVTYR